MSEPLPSSSPKGTDTNGAATTAKAVPAVRRAAAILWLLAERRTPLSLSEIARAIDSLPSTALHILRELASARLIELHSNKRYSLGEGIITIAGAVQKRDRFVEIARPHLQDLVDRFGVTATATVMVDDTHTACVASISPPRDMSLNVTLGGRVPRLAGAAGRCIALHLDGPRKQMRQEFQQIRWKSPISFDDWMGEVKLVQINGYAEDDGLFSLGVLTLASPVTNGDGGMAGIVGIASISATLEHPRRAEAAAALVHAATAISEALASYNSPEYFS